MKADSLPLKTLFQRDVRYVIPTFQRPYVWNQEDQWEPLWEDVRNVAERFLDQLQLAEGNVPLAEERTGSHFLGAVVLQQRPTPVREIETRDVIDGQQRMTTLQLLIDAAQQVMEEIHAEDEANRLSRLVTNAFAKGDNAFKLWPTALDQDAFRAAMNNGTNVKGFEDSPIVQAHEFFQLQIREWLDSATDDALRSSRIQGLETALFGLLEVVVIDLSTSDDAFVIFETLNARGTPLLASDLVKNYLLQTAKSNGTEPDELYESQWKALEDPWWRQEARQGRLVRPRLDIYLNYWLTMRTASETPSQDVFPIFKAYVESNGRQVASIAEDLRRVGTIYRGLDDFDAFSAEGTFLHRWRAIDAGSSTPVLLWILSQHADALPRPDALACLAALESYLVRRMLCRMTTKDYNRLFLELLNRLSEAGPENARAQMSTYLAEQGSESRRWPNDREVQHALLDLPLYRLLTRKRLQLILEAVEESLRSPYSDQAHVPRSVYSLEHVLPQTWRQHWPLGVGSSPEAEIDRERLLHTVGNLTLVNPKLNTKLSNNSWAEKRKLIEANAVLHLNKEIVNEFGANGWSESAIRDRGRHIAERVCTIWPVG